MEIEFNPSRVPKPGFDTTVTRSGAPTAASEQTTFTDQRPLQSKLKDIPIVRPDQVEKARELASEGHYPPDWILERIATLLALNLKQ